MLQKNKNVEISYPSEGSKKYFEIEEKSFWFEHRNKVILNVIKKFPFKDRFIDVGGGNGFQTKFLSKKIKKEFILVEPNYDGFLNAKKRGIKKCFNKSAESFIFEKYNPGGIGLFDVLEHIKEDSKFIKSLSNKLNKGTKIYITVPAHTFLWSKFDDYAGHYRRYNLKQIKKLSKDTDMKLIYSTNFFSYLTPAIFLFRRIPYLLSHKKIDSIGFTQEEELEHTPPIIINKILKIFGFLERKILRKTNINIGGSILFILKK